MQREPDAKVDWGKVADRPVNAPGRQPRKHLKQLVTDGMPVSKGAPVDPDEMTHEDAVRARAAALIGGVNLTWLAAAFRIDTRTCRKRLAGLKPVAIGKRDTEIYDFVEAATFLAPPQQDKFARWISNLRTSDLPVHIMDTYWAALRKRQIWEQNACELWKTEDVSEVLGETFKTLKTTTQLWVDKLDSDNTMPQDQRNKLQQMVDGLLAELYSSLVDMPGKKMTRSSLYDPEVITNQTGDGPKFVDDPDEEEDLIG